MSIRTVLLFVAIVTSVALAPTAYGAWWHEFGRSCGLGWSDGYHSRSGCQPRRSYGSCQPGAQPLYLHTPTGSIVPADIKRSPWHEPTTAR